MFPFLGQQRKPAQVVLRLPADHPKAPALRRMFDRLSTTVQRSSGLMLETGRKDDAAVHEALSELNQVFLEEGVDLHQIVRKVLGESSPPNPGDILGALQSPLFAQEMMAGLLKQGGTR